MVTKALLLARSRTCSLRSSSLGCHTVHGLKKLRPPIQTRLYMKSRQTEVPAIAAAKAGFSTGRGRTSATSGGFQKRPDLPDLLPRSLAGRDCLSSPETLFEIAVTIATGPAGAPCPAVHSTPCPAPYRGLLAGVTGAGACATPLSFGQIGQPALNIRLTHGVVCHVLASPSRFPVLPMPTSPCPPEWMWTCLTSTVCVFPRRRRPKVAINSACNRNSFRA
jgi:hypothetical protein